MRATAFIVAGFSLLPMSLHAQAKFNGTQFKTPDGVELHTRIYEPNAGGTSQPAILMVEGFGKSHLDKEPESSPFFQLAEALSQNGYVVMVYSKRGSASNAKNGSWAKSTFSSDNADAQSALDFLKAYRGVDRENVYLFGQSIGCLHVSILAQKNKVKGVIAFAGGYQNFFTILEEQNIEILRLMGKSPDEAKKATQPMMLAYSQVKAGNFNCEKNKELCHQEDGANIVDDAQEAYLAEVFKMDPLKELAKISAPVLVLQGTSDFVISTSEFDLAKKSLGANKNFSFQLLENVDHFMTLQKDKAASLKAMAAIKQTKTLGPLSTKLSAATETWLKKQSYPQ